MLCSDLQVMEKSLCSLSWEITCLDFWHFWIPTIHQEELDHFWPCQFQSPTLSTSVESWRKRVYLQVNKVSSLYLSIVYIDLHEISPFSGHLQDSAANPQQSAVKEEGKSPIRDWVASEPIINKLNNQLEPIWEWREAGITQQQLSTVNKTQQSTNRNAPFLFTQSGSGSGKAKFGLWAEIWWITAGSPPKEQFNWKYGEWDNFKIANMQ